MMVRNDKAFIILFFYQMIKQKNTPTCLQISTASQTELVGIEINMI